MLSYQTRKGLFKRNNKKMGSNYNFKRWTCPNLNVYEIFKGISIEC